MIVNFLPADFAGFLFHDEDFAELFAARLSSVGIAHCAFNQGSRNSSWCQLSWGRCLVAGGVVGLSRLSDPGTGWWVSG